MLSWAIAFLVIALIAAVLGFGGIAGTAMSIAQLIFYVAILLLMLVTAILYGLLVLLSAPIADWITRAPLIGEALRERLAFLEEPARALQNLRDANAGDDQSASMDTALVAALADLRPDWQFTMIGPIVKIDPADLPQRPNLHWRGGRAYEDLPQELAEWTLGIMPFALNEATRFISPTKTPEFLAAGLPVVSTPIRDVLHPYADRGLVGIGATAESFIARYEECMQWNAAERAQWLANVDRFLSHMSWDLTWSRMIGLVDHLVTQRRKMRSAPLAKPASPLSAPGAIRV